MRKISTGRRVAVGACVGLMLWPVATAQARNLQVTPEVQVRNGALDPSMTWTARLEEPVSANELPVRVYFGILEGPSYGGFPAGGPDADCVVWPGTDSCSVSFDRIDFLDVRTGIDRVVGWIDDDLNFWADERDAAESRFAGPGDCVLTVPFPDEPDQADACQGLPMPGHKPEPDGTDVAEAAWTTGALNGADVMIWSMRAHRGQRTSDPVTYSLEIVNLGPERAEGVDVALQGEGLMLRSAVTSRGSCVVSGATGGCAIGGLESEQRATLLVSVRETQPGGARLTATASSRGPADPDLSNNFR